MILPKLLEFQWDEGNIFKNLRKHGLTKEEIEKSFFDKNRIIFKDEQHSLKEDRAILVGKNDGNKILYVVFTMRSNKIRVVSAREINRKEKYIYEKTT